MRRFVALFKRKDKPDSTTVSSSSTDARSNRTAQSSSVKKPSRFFKSLSVKTVKSAVIREPPHPVPQPPLQASSFSTSSTDSPAPATPDDDSEFGPSASRRNSNQWSERKLALSLPVAGGSFGWDPHQNPSLSLPQIPTVAESSDSEDSDDGSTTTSSPPSISPPLPVSPHTSLHSLTTYALAPTFSVPPLLYLPNLPLFPRSVNTISSLPHQETMASMFFKTQILRRLNRRDLTVSKEPFIATFTSRRSLPAKSQFLLSNQLDDGQVCDLKRASNVSQGLKRWISRPCFEDRMLVYTPGPSGLPHDIAVHNVTGGSLGVAALEVSEIIEVLAGYNLEEQSETIWLPVLSSPSTADFRPSLPAPAVGPAITAQTRKQPRKADPSPLRTETTNPSPDQTKTDKPKLQPSLSSKSPSSTSPTNVTTPGKRVRSSVRFDVDEKQDKDEHVPLGQIMRIRRGREERAKFLELEKERRALEEQRQKHEAEKRKWEQERRAWEAERKAAEEEKKKRLYQQEVIAARKRRESQILKVGSSPTDPLEMEPQSNRRQGSYSRPAYDSSRQQNPDGSSPAVPQPPLRDDSSNSLRDTSKPQSLRSIPLPSPTSSDTVSSAGDAMKMTGQRTSILPGTPPQFPMLMQPYGYPWGIPVVPHMPMPMQMVPQMPCYAVDNMPLLPPTAPFMMQRAGDRRNSRPSSPNRSPTSIGKSANQSMDRLSLSQGNSPKRRPAGHQRSSSGGSSNQLGNGQRSNQGSVSSRRSSGIVNDPNQWRNSTRSRPPMPQSHSQRPGSWVVPSPVPQMRHQTVS